jgi:hypothetical protein
VRTKLEVYADALKSAEIELRQAQAALQVDDSDTTRARYARAVASHDELQGMFPFVAAGLGDEVV